MACVLVVSPHQLIQFHYFQNKCMNIKYFIVLNSNFVHQNSVS